MRSRLISKVAILAVIAEKRALDIFKTIASARLNTDILITELKLTRKQYYSGVSRLTKSDLVKRQKGRCLLTAFGKVIYSAQMSLEAKIESALNNYWKLKAVDSLEISSSQEHNEIISALINNQEIKSILMKEEPHLSGHAAIKKTQEDVQDKLLTISNFP
jgi:hypothetical protein